MRYLFLVLCLAGCKRRNGMPELVNWQDNLMPLASFQLECPEQSLTVIDLGFGEKAGVRGCGQSATYIYDGHRGWNRADTVSVELGPETGSRHGIFGGR